MKLTYCVLQIVIEDQDGEVVKTYELPTQKAEGAEPGPLENSLRFIGLGGRPRPADPEAAAEEGQASGATAPPVTRRPSRIGWASFTGAAQRPGAERKKSTAEQGKATEEAKIRFTIGGVGQRMTEEDFIKELQKLDSSTRKEVVDKSTASGELKSRAKQDPLMKDLDSGAAITDMKETPSDSTAEEEEHAIRASGARWEESPSPKQIVEPKGEDGETAVELRRRLAVLSNQVEESGETPAERRRREAALGMGSPALDGDSDSEDEGADRVPPARRGIRFAEPERGRK